MNPKHLQYLRCPSCASSLLLDPQEIHNARVKTGSLSCTGCQKSFQIINFIPRLILEPENYADDFGFQWNKHYRTQYDSYSGVNVSEHRFFDETGWPRQMSGQLLLEAGCGSGRFTEHAVATDAMVVSFDYSRAVEANYRNNGNRDNLLIVQASIYNMPFPIDYFDKVLCIGVLQHTPNPEGAFLALTRMLKQGGNIVVDAYERLPGWRRFFETKYWVRPVTRRISNERLYRLCEAWVHAWWPILKLAYKVSGRRTLSWALLVADYRGVYPLREEMLKEWSVLDTFDMLAPEYDFPQTVASVRAWFDKAGLTQVDVRKGYNGIQGRGTRA